MVARETGKDRAARIPYNYLGGGDGFVARRVALSAVALCAIAVWVAWGLVDRDEGRSRLSHGPLTASHAAWDTRCDACHAPLDLGRAVREGLPRIVSDDGDHRCQSCHMGGADQMHHAATVTDRVPHCAECHRDHAGREASLVQLPDASCTACHRDLDSAVAPPHRLKFEKSISHFDSDGHPAFLSARSDPGRLKFNHALHMTRGLLFTGGSGRPVTFAGLPAADHQRYGWRKGVDLGAWVQLDCASCHRLDDRSDVGTKQADILSAGGRPSASPGGGGAYYRPILYERDCAACHPLTIAGGGGERPAARLPALGIGEGAGDRGASGGGVVVPHRLQPAELTDLLRTIYLGLFLAEDPGLADNGSSLQNPSLRPIEDSTRRRVAERAESAARTLLGRGKTKCTECHYYSDPSGREHKEPDGPVVPRDWRVQPTQVPLPWLKHGRFDHASHRAVDCRSCHARAFADHPDASGRGTVKEGDVWLRSDRSPTWKSHDEVLVPGIENCKECHAPRGRVGGVPTGGARYDCTECHTYHDGDHPGRGRGSDARGLPERDRKDIRAFLLGTQAAGVSATIDELPRVRENARTPEPAPPRGTSGP